MERKIPVDLVILQLAWPHDDFEAIAIRDGKVINAGSIPYIFSNYKGEELFHAQGNALVFFQWNEEANTFAIDNSINRIVGKEVEFGLVTEFNSVHNEVKKENILAYWKSNSRLYFNEDLLDKHWDDH